MTIDVSVLSREEPGGDLWKSGADQYDYNRLPADLRSQAMLAQGTVVEGLSIAVRRVMEAGRALSWAKAELPHGEYLPWVQQACGLKPDYAARLIKAADWASNVEHVPHFNGVTDIATLFLLSADTTPEDVRDWFMERCAAGEVPSRAEVQDRKRNAGRPRPPQPTEALALSIIRKGEVERLRAALALAEQAQELDAEAVMDEIHLRQLPKGSVIYSVTADFHRLKDGRWVRLPHAGQIDVIPQDLPAVEPELAADNGAKVLSLEQAAAALGLAVTSLRTRISPKQLSAKGPLVRNGWRASKAGRGQIRLEQVNE
jgi:hypothetical protein